MRIEVTAEDIRGAKCGDPEGCILARALLHAGFERPAVGGVGAKERCRAYVGPFGARKRVPLPEVARLAACDFDAGRPVRPFRFDIDNPSSTTPQDGGGEP